MIDFGNIPERVNPDPPVPNIPPLSWLSFCDKKYRGSLFDQVHDLIQVDM